MKTQRARPFAMKPACAALFHWTGLIFDARTDVAPHTLIGNQHFRLRNWTVIARFRGRARARVYSGHSRPAVTDAVLKMRNLISVVSRLLPSVWRVPSPAHASIFLITSSVVYAWTHRVAYEII